MFDYEHLTRQLLQVGIGEHNADAPIVDAIEVLAVTLDSLELSTENRSVVLQLFSKVGLEQLRDTSGRISAAAGWIPFQLGVTTYGDEVRVQLDAYDSPSGSRHNGLVGTVESVNGGRVGVRYIGRYADELQVHHRDKLDVLKKV